MTKSRLSEDLGSYDRTDWYPTSRNSASGGGDSGTSPYDVRNRNSTTAYEAEDQYTERVPERGQERGRAKQRFTAPSSAVRAAFSQRQQHYEREGGSTPRSQFDGTSSYTSTTDKHGDKPSRSGVRGPKAWGGSQSPARSDVSSLSSRQRNLTFGRSPSRSGSRSPSNDSTSSSRSSSSSSRSGSRRTGTVKSEVASKKEIIVTAVTVGGGSGSGSGGSGGGSGGENSGEKRNLGICIRGLPMRSTDSSLRDGLYHEYKKHGKVTSVSIFGQGDDRYAIVSFKKPEDATKAIEASHEKMFFGTKIHVTSHEGFDLGLTEAEDDFKAPEADLDEFHPKATRTLFVGNLEKEITILQLKDIFKPFGEIIDIDIKKQGAVSAYAFVQYGDITSVVRALRQMDGEHIGANKIKLGFGKSMPTNCVWLDNVSETVAEKVLCRQFGRYGSVSHSVIDKVKGRALIYFDNMDYAQHAVNEMRARVISGKKIHIDFASRDCQTSFFEKMERTGQLRPGERPDERAGRVHRTASGTYSVRYDPTVTIAATTEITKEVPREKEAAFVATRSTRLSRADSGDSSYTFNSPGTTTQPRTFPATTTTVGRGNFSARGGRASRTARPGFFEGAYTQDSEFRERGRQRGHYDDYNQEGAYGEDTYEQELRAYGYRQQERRERGSLSPRDKRGSREVRAESPFSRGSRHPSPVHDTRHAERYDDRYSDRYSDRYRDTDSQSGDRESVRSYRSVRSEARRSEFRQQTSFDDRYPERFVEEKRDHVRGFSPTSSDYSHHSGHSPSHYRSRSTSPAVSVGKERKVMNVKERVVVRQVVAASSLDGYTQSSRHSSPLEYEAVVPSGKLKDIKLSKYSSNPMDTKSKEHYPETRDSRERYGSEERTTISKLIGKTRTGSTYNDSEKITAVSSKVKKPKFDSDDEVSDMDRVSEVKDRPYKKRHSEDVVVEKDRTTDDGNKKLHKHRSRSTSLGSRTRHSIPNDSSDTVDYIDSSGTVSKPTRDVVSSEVCLKAKTKNVKLDLLRCTKKNSEPYDPFEAKSESGESSSNSSSGSSGESSSEEEASSFVEPSPSTLSSSTRLQQEREHLLSLIKQLDESGSTSDNDSHLDDNGTRKRLRLDEGSEAESRAKSRQLLYEEIEQTKLSIQELDREQREKAPQIDSTKSYRKQMEQQRIEQQKHTLASGGLIQEVKVPGSPQHVSWLEIDQEVVEPTPVPSPKEIPTEFKKKRKGDTEIDLNTSKTRRYRGPNATDDLFARMNEVDCHKKGRKEAPEIKEADMKVVDGRSSSVDMSKHPSRQSSIESQDPRSPPLEYSSSSMGMRRDRADSDSKDSPMDRRSLHLAESQSKKDFPMSLPLPKFARQPMKDNHTGGKNSPKSLVSPKTITSSLTVAAIPSGMIQVKSPPFSPGGALASPLHSPALPKGDTPKEASSLPNSTTTTPTVLSKDKDIKHPLLVLESPREKPSLKGMPMLASPGSPVFKDSDSEVSESEPGELSLEERIRQLDEKLSQKPPSTPSSTSLFDYREKYKIRKRADSSTSSLSSLSDNRSEPSDIVKSLLARTSIFDQDSKRLEQIHEKYEPKMNVILDDTARSLGVFRTKASAKELPLLALGGLTTMTASLGPEAGSAPQLSPPFLGAPASAAPAEITILLSAGEMLGNNTNSSSGVATGAFNDAAFPSAPPHKVVGGGDDESPLLPPPPPTTAGPQSTPPSPVSPTILTTSSGSTQPARSASPKLTGLDTMPQLSVAVNTPAMSPGLISRKGSLESATKSPLTPPVATTATSNIAAMPSPSQTKPPQLECLTPPQLECLITTPIKKFNKESVSSSISHHSSTSSAPSTPVSILKKQDSNEVFSPVTQITPILKKEMPPLTPILREPTLRKDPRIESQSYTAMSSTGTPLQREIVSQPTSILGKRKTSDETKEKLSMLKQEKGNHKSSSLNTMPKHEPGTSKPTGEQTEAKKGKVVAKEKASKSSSQKDGRKASTKQSSSSSNSKSPEKKNLKADTKELAEKKKQDDKHMKHVEKMPSKDRSSPREEEPTDKPKLSEPAKEKIWEAEKELPKVKEHQEREQKDVSKSKEVKHKFDKVKELKEVPEKKVEKVEPVREKKRSKSGDIKHRDKERTPSIDLKTKTTNDKHKDKHKTVEKPQMMSHDKTDKVDKEEKQEPQEKIEKVDPRIDKMRVEHTEKAKTESKEKPTKHDKKIEKQEPKLKHKDKSKDNSKEKKEDKNKTGHESRESSIKPEKKITKDGEKKKAKQKERDQDKADRKDGEKNRDGPKTKSDKKNKDLEAHKEKDKETDSSSVDKNETKEEREKREMRELLELQDRLNAEEGYGLTMYDKVKRRSSKERDKEFEFAARQKQFSAYQSSWRLKKRPSRSEYAGSSTQNSDNESATSSSTMEMPSTKRERSESKSKSRKQRIIESSSEAEDEFSAPDLLDMPSLKEKEMKKTVVKVENAFDLSEDDMPVVTPVKKLRKKDQQDKKEKPKKKKPVPINSDTDEEIPEKEVYHIPPSPAPTPGKAKEKKVKNKTKIEPSESKDHMKDHAKDHLKDQTIEYTKDKDHAKDHPMVAKNQKMTPKAKAKKNRIFSSDDEMELVHIKALKKESSAKKHAILDTSTTEEEELVMPKPKAKKHKEKVPKHRVIDSDSEDKDQEKPPVTTKTHKEKMKEKAMASVIFTTVSEMDGLPMDPAPALTPTPKQKKNKDKHKLSQRKEKALVDEMRWEEPVEIKHERPEKPKDKEESSGQSEWDPHHMSKGSPITGKDKESSHNKSGKTVSETSVLKERDSHGNKDQKSRNKDHGESYTNDGMQVEKERGKDRSHQDAIASMILEIRTRGEVYEEDPNMPNLDEDKHPLDELLKEEARLDAEKKRDEKLFGHHDDSNKKNDYCHNDLGPPEIRIKMEDISDVDIKEPEPPKLRDEESLKKQGKREGIKKGKKAKRKCKVHEENTVCSTSNLDNEVPPSMIVLKEEPIDQLPSLTKENLSEQPPILEENAIKEELPRPDIRRSGTDNIFEKMEMKEDGLLTVETGVSLSEAPSLQPVILSPSKKEVKKEAEKLKETSQDELQRAVESILGTDTPPATSAPTRIDYPEEQQPETFIDPLEDSPLVIESEVISQPSEVVDLPSEPEATDVSTDVTAVNEQDEEEARNAAAALAFLQDNTEHLQATVLLTEQTVSPEEAQAEAEIPQELELPAEEMQEELQPEDLEVTPLQPEPIKPSDISEEETPLKAELEVELPQQVSDQSIKQEIPDVTTTSEVVEIPKLVPKVEPEKPEDVIIPQTQSSEVNEASKLAVFLPESESEVVPIPVVQPEPVTEPLPTPITEPLPTPITEPLPTPITELLPTPITEPLPTPVLVVATPPMSPVLPPVLLSHPVIPTQVVEPLSMLLPLPKSDPIVKETKKDPYIFDEEEPEEGVPLLDKLRHKPHVEPRPVLSTLKAPILEETLASIVHDIPKIKSPELGSPDRRILSETEKVDTPVRKPKRQRTPKSARGRKKVEQELRSEIEFKEEGPRLEMDKDELKISENQENVFDHVRMELRREEKPEIRQSPRAKEKAVIPLTPVSSTSLFVEDKPIFEQPDRPELKMKFPLDPEAQKKVRGEGKKQEALETVSAPLEPPVVKLTAPLHEEPLHTIEPPTNTEDLAVDEPTKAHQVSEDELTTDEPSELFSETVPPMRRTKGKTKKANKDDNREEMETKESSGSLTMTLSLRDVQRSPSTRGRGKQEEQAAAKKEVPEVTFSSRGRKIIPKERDGEVAPVGRKGRSKQAGPVAPENPESRGRGRRGAGSPAAAMMEPDVAAPRLKPQRSRRTSKRLEKEEEVQDCEEGKKDSLKSPENKEDAEDELSDNDGRVGRRVPKRRISLRRGLPVGSDKDRAVDKDENRDDSSKDGFFHEENSIGRSETDTSTTEIVPDAPRQKKGRRKGRKFIEGSSLSPRRAEVPPGSPRAKGLEMGSTSPKNTEYKPVVKLEKLSNVEEMLRHQDSNRAPKEETIRKEDEVRDREEGEHLLVITGNVAPRTGITFSRLGDRLGVRPINANPDAALKQTCGAKPKKDQYDFEDDEEKAPAGYVPRRTKRKVAERMSPRRYDEVSQDPASAPEQQPAKRLKIEGKTETSTQDSRRSDDVKSVPERLPETPAVKKADEEKNVYLDPKTGLLQSIPASASPEAPQTPDATTSTLAEATPRPDVTKRDVKPEVKPHVDDGNTRVTITPPYVVPPSKADLRKEERAAAATHQQPAPPVKAEPTVPPLKITIPISSKSSTPSWETNIDKVIEAVARGDFSQENDDNDFVQKRSRRRSQDQHSPHSVPESKPQPQPAATVLVTSAACPVVPPITVSKASRAMPATTQVLHGAPQVAFPPLPYPHSTAPITTTLSKVVATHAGMPQTTLVPSMHAMPQQLPHPGPQTAQLHPLQVVSPGAVKSPGPGAMMQLQQQPLISKSTPSSVIQPPHHTTTPTSSGGGAGLNPLLQLQQAGYPMRESGNEKDQRVTRQQSPAGAKPAVSSAASVQMDVVQQAYSISHQEASPPGQVGKFNVIEIVPNPNIISPKSSPGEPSIHLPPSISQQQREAQQQREQQQKHQQQQHQQQQEQQRAAVSGTKVSPHGHTGHHMPPSQVSKDQKHGGTTHPGPLMQHFSPYSHPTILSQQTTTTTQSSSLPQTSELRAALATPSKLQQQEQFLQQQQRLQQQQQQQQQQLMRPHQPLTPHQQEQQQQPSPGNTFGLHRMPFTFPDQRQAISRAEPKVSQEQRADMATSQAQYREHLQKGPPTNTGPGGSSAFSQPHPGQGVPLGHPEGRTLPYPGAELRFPHPGVVGYPGGPPPGMAMGLGPRLSIDPRFMFAGPGVQPPQSGPGHPAHHDYLMGQGMMPQHLRSQHTSHQQPPTAVDQILLQDRPPSGRPLSRTTPPSAQPSPRGTPTPGGGRELTPQGLSPGSIPSALTQHPSQALNSLMKGPGSLQEVQHHADNLYMILRRYPVMWQGVLALKNDSSNVQMHYLAGSQRLVKQALPAMTLDGHSAPLRIAQRMRLEQSQLDGVHRKMQNEEEYSMLLAIPCGRDHIDIMTQTKALQSGFIQYLSSKQAAGIVNVAEPGSASQQPAYVVHIFPQCEFSHQQMADLTPDLLQGIHEISHLLIVIATVGTQ